MDNEKAFERAKSAYGTGAYDDATLEFLFPQLRDSEDEKKVKGFIDTLRKVSCFAGNEYLGVEIADCIGWFIDWLEKQKEQKPWKVGANAYFTPEQKPEWSEEDERILKGIIGLIDHNQHYGVGNKEMLDWLKSLRPRSQWKPSEEQMEALKRCVDGWTDDGDGALDSLYNDLKKLR